MDVILYYLYLSFKEPPGACIRLFSTSPIGEYAPATPSYSMALYQPCQSLIPIVVDFIKFAPECESGHLMLDGWFVLVNDYYSPGR